MKSIAMSILNKSVLFLWFLVLSAGTVAAQDAAQDINNWNTDLNQYIQLVELQAKLIIGLEYSSDSRDKVAIFKDNECHGVGSPFQVDDEYLLSISMGSNNLQDTFSIYIYDASRGEIYLAKDPLIVNFDGNGFVGSFSEPYLIFAASLNVDVQQTDVACAEGKSGAVSIAVSGGEPPYQILWEDGAQEFSRKNLMMGTYPFTITDGANNIFADRITLNNLELNLTPPELNINGDLPLCSGEPIFVLANHDTLTHADFEWFDQVDDAASVFTGDAFIFSGIDQDTLVYVRSNIGGCVSQKRPVLVALQKPNVSFSVLGETDIAQGGLLQFTPDSVYSDYHYSWDFGDNGWSYDVSPWYFFNVLGDFDISLTVTDPEGCTNTQVRQNLISVSRDHTPGIRNNEVEPRTGSRKNALQASVFPNPFIEYVQIVFQASDKMVYNCYVYNLSGQVKQQNKFLAVQGMNTFRLRNLESLPSGNYIILLTNGTQAKAVQITHQ